MEGARERRQRSASSEETPEPGTNCRVGTGVYGQRSNPAQIFEDRGIALSELQRSLKIVQRASEPKLMAVQIEGAEQRDAALELRIGESYRIKIGAGFCAGTLRRLLEVLASY